MPFGEISKETMSEGVGSGYVTAGGRRPLFPGEAPAKGDLERWVRDYAKAESADVMTALRGGVPAKLAADTQPFDNLLLETGAAGVASIQESALALARIKAVADNAQKAEFRANRLRELRNEGGTRLLECMELRAGLRRRKLEANHTVVHGGADYLEGAAIWTQLCDLSICPDSISEDAAKEKLDELEREPFMDGITGDEFAKRITLFERDINPYLAETKSPKNLVRWIYEQLPGSAHFIKVMVREEARVAGRTEDASFISGRLVTELNELRKSMNKSMGINPSMAAMGLGFVAGAYGSSRGGAAAQVQAAFAGARRLPLGQRCPEGTCCFAHKGACWASAKFTGRITKSLWDDKAGLAELEAARLKHAKEIGVTYKPIPGPNKPREKQAQRKDVKAKAALEARQKEHAQVTQAATKAADDLKAAGERGLLGMLAFGGTSELVPPSDDLASDLVAGSPGESGDDEESADEDQATFWKPTAPASPSPTAPAVGGMRPQLFPTKPIPNRAPVSVGQMEADVPSSLGEGLLNIPVEELDGPAVVTQARQLAGVILSSRMSSTDPSDEMANASRRLIAISQEADRRTLELGSDLRSMMEPSVKRARRALLVRERALAAEENAVAAPPRGESTGAIAVMLFWAFALVLACVVAGPGVFSAVAQGYLGTRHGPPAVAGVAAPAEGVEQSTIGSMELPRPGPSTMLFVFAAFLAYVFGDSDEGAYIPIAYIIAASRRLMGYVGRRALRIGRGAAYAIVFYLIISTLSLGSAEQVPSHSTVHRASSVLSLFEPRPGDAAARVNGHVLTKNDCIVLNDGISAAKRGLPYAMLSAGDTNALRVALDCGPSDLINLWDTGAAEGVLESERYAIEGSKRKNTTKVSTANGVVTPEWRVDAKIPMQVKNKHGHVSVVPLIIRQAILIPQCAHTLIPGAALAKSHGLGFEIAAWSGEARVNIHNEKIAPAGSTVPLINAGVLVLPSVKSKTTGPPAMAGSAEIGSLDAGGQVTAGTRGATGKVDYWTWHERICHHEDWYLLHGHECWADVHAPLKPLVSRVRPPCDDCLRSNKSAKGRQPGSHAPVVTKPGELVSFDCWKVKCPYRWGKQTIVLMFVDHFSKRKFPYLLASESECPAAYRAFVARAKSDGVDVLHTHTDNALIFAAPGVTRTTCRSIADSLGIHFTTSCEYEPQQNGTCEVQWSKTSACTRRCLTGAGATRDLWWDAFEHVCFVDALLPLRDSPSETGFSRWHRGLRPKFASWVRPWGCVCYPKIPIPASKVHDQSVRCMYLGRSRSQPGFKCFDPQTGRIYVSTNVDFVEREFPGITIGTDGREQIVPSFAKDFDSAAPLAPGQVNPTAPSDPTDGVVPHTARQPVARAPRQSARAPPGPAAPISQRLSREGRGVRAVSFAGEATDMVFSVGSEPMEATSSPLHVPDGKFVIYVGCGPARDGDLASWLLLRGTECMEIDPLRAGKDHDVTREAVTSQLRAAAALARCVAVMVSLPCSTWSAARFEPGGPPVLRDVDYPMGIPDEHDRLPSEILRANRLLQNAVGIMAAAESHGARVVLECPAWRGEGSPVAMPGRERHASMLSFRPLLDWAVQVSCVVVTFDQCMTGVDAWKTTHLLCSAPAVSSAKAEFESLQCNHSHHVSKLKNTKGLEQYTPDMNRRLARVLVPDEVREGSSDEDDSRSAPSPLDFTDIEGDIVDAVGRSSRRPGLRPLPPPKLGLAWAVVTSALGLVSGASTPGGLASAAVNSVAPALNTAGAWRSLLAAVSRPQPGGDDSSFTANASMMATDIPDGLSKNLYAAFVADTVAEADANLDVAFAVSGAEGNDTGPKMYFEALFGDAFAVKTKGGDFPSYGQALRENPKTLEDACEKEIATLRSFNAFEEVPEDSLPSWRSNWIRSWDKTGAKGQASEVTDTLWALRKKTGPDGNVTDLKARCAFDGAQRQRKMKATSARTGVETKVETFSPATMQATRSCLCAKGKADNKVCFCFDVKGAYLQGDPLEHEVVYARPPVGYRTFDDRGVPIVWRMLVPLYGQEDAGRIWYRTLITFCTSNLRFNQSDVDPCYLWKTYPDGTRFDMVLYVDDGLCFASRKADGKMCVAAQADVDALTARFTMTVEHEPKQFLGSNIDNWTDDGFRLTMRKYVGKLAKECLAKPLESYRATPTPCRAGLLDAWEKAKEEGAQPDVARVSRFQRVLGKLMFAVSGGVRPDLAYAVGICARCTTIPNAEIEKCLEHAVVYACRTPDYGVEFKSCDDPSLVCYTDSDWHFSHSTSSFLAKVGDACVDYSSRRQQCIAMSSTEAEIIAASSASLSLLFLRALMVEMGCDMSKPVVLLVDNSGAVELSKDRKSAQRTRHVCRRYLKVRELVAEGLVKVQWVDTKSNLSDLLSKGTFTAEEHDSLCKRLMSQGGAV